MASACRTGGGWHPFHPKKITVGKKTDSGPMFRRPMFHSELPSNVMIRNGTLVLPEAFLISCASATCERWDGTGREEHCGVAVLYDRMVNHAMQMKFVFECLASESI